MSPARELCLVAVVLAASALVAQDLPPTVYTSSTERFWVHYTREGLPEARVAKQCADDCLARVEARLGLAVEGRVHLYVAATHTELEQLVGGPESFLIEGRALPDKRAVLMRGKVTTEAARALLAHELVHIALAQRLHPEGVAAPRWLDEGLAELVADDVTPGARRRRPGHAAGGPLPFSSLAASFPRDASQQNLAYAQSRSFVGFLEQRTADRGLSGLLAALAESGSIDRAFALAYGSSLEEFEAEWAPGFQAARPRPWALDTGMAIFAAMTVLFILTMLLRWRRRARAAREEEEEDLEPDEYPYWEVPPEP